MRERVGHPFGDRYVEIAPIGVIIPKPPADYRRLRSVLGTIDPVPCADCGGDADLIFFWGLPAQPYCPACWQAVGSFDSARAVLARKDEVGVWRATSQLGTICEDPFDFDW